MVSKTPERKGKRETERFPFAIASDKYHETFKKKNDKDRKKKETRDQKNF